MSVVLRASVLAKHYGGLQALRDVSFDVSRGELVAVIGPNGAGKTTLLSIIAGVQAASAGSVERDPGAPASTDGSRVGWVPQQSALYSKLSVAENFELFARLERVPDPRSAVRRMLEQSDLRDRAREPVGRLSGGNRQRVNVALGLIGDPPVLVLDEPSTALDPTQRERLWEFIAGLLAGGRSALFSTHNVSEAQRHAHRVLVLADGRLLFDGTPAALLAQGGESAGGDLERALVRFLGERAPARGGDVQAGAHPEGAL